MTQPNQYSPRRHQSYQYGPLNFDRDSKIVSINGSELKLSDREHKVLVILADANGTLSQTEILRAMYGKRPDMPEEKMIDVLVCKARKKMSRLHPGLFIETVWGEGYRATTPAASLIAARR